MSGRAIQILSRFPSHMEAARVGKQLGAVTEALAGELDQLSSAMAAVRRAHRLAHADTLRDVLFLGGLHAIGLGDLDVALAAIASARDLLAQIGKAVAEHIAADRDAAAQRLLDLWGLDLGNPGLPIFAPPSVGPPDLDRAATRLVQAAQAKVSTRAIVDLARRRVGRLARLHAAGNGTVRALLDGTASALDLELDLDKNAAVKELSRPVVTVTPGGATQGASYSYVVMARSAARSVARQSVPATVVNAATKLTPTNCNVLTWAQVPDALDFLVFRTASSDPLMAAGLLTATSLPATTTTFSDGGLAVGAALPPEIDDDLFHSRDLFWHSTYARDAARLTREVDVPPQAKAVRMGATLLASALAPQLGAAVKPGDVMAQLALARPVAAVAAVGAAGTASYTYTVLARSAVRGVQLASLPATVTSAAAALSATDFNSITWPAVPNALEYFVFRAASTGAPATTGWVSASLPAATLSFQDTGLAPLATAPPPETLDFWLTADAATRLAGRMGAVIAPSSTMAATQLAVYLGCTVGDLLAMLVQLDASGLSIDFALAAATVEPIAAAYQLPLIRTDLVLLGQTTTVTELALKIGAAPADVLQKAVEATSVAELGLDSELTFADAGALLALLGLSAVAQRTIAVERTIAVADLANQLAVRLSVALANLALLGTTATGATLLTPDEAAPLAQKYGYTIVQTVPLAEQLIGMEENPLQVQTSDPQKRVHAEIWAILRKGFGPTAVEITVAGIGDRTIGPMVVNRDQGIGVAFAGAVPEGQVVVFNAGRVTLRSADPATGKVDPASVSVDVTAQSWGWTGACFADDDDDPLHPQDFVFAGPGDDPARRATFAVATPFDALDAGFTFPTAGADLPMPGIAVGRTRFAFFVQEAHLSGAATVQPRFEVGFADGSVYAPALAEPPNPSGWVGFEWNEHEAYAVRVLIPSRFKALETGATPTILQRVATALDRIRPAGVEVRVEYLDPTWVIDEGYLSGAAAADPILSLRGGTVLSPSPSP